MGAAVSSRTARLVQSAVAYVILISGAIVVLSPLIWMVVTAFKPTDEVLTGELHLLPSHWQWSNFADAWHAAPFGRYFLNSFLVAAAVSLLDLLLVVPAAYAFAKMRFPGKQGLFYIFLATMMVPGEMTLIPNYLTLVKLNWIDSYWALIVPFCASVFILFLIRQHFASLPNELYEAAAMDGCSRWRYLWRVAVPLSRPALVTGGLLKFVGAWNSFLWVIIVTNSPEMRTVPVGLDSLVLETGTHFNVLMAAAVMAALPLLVLFLVAERQFVQGIARAGLKG